MFKNFGYVLKVLLYLGICLGFSAGLAVAREGAKPTDDPLKKPQLWSKLLENPADTALWTSYVGKPWIALTYPEKEKIRVWKEEIFAKMAAAASEANQGKLNTAPNEGEDFWGNIANTYGKPEDHVVVVEKEKAAYFAQLEAVVVAEPSELGSLKTNIAANFVIIEETYREEFEDLGIKYKDYQATHPDGKYSQELWVKEKANELKMLKKKSFEKMKMEMVGKK